MRRKYRAEDYPMDTQTILASQIPAPSVMGYYPGYYPQATVGTPAPQALIYQDDEDPMQSASQADLVPYMYGYDTETGFSTGKGSTFWQRGQ